MKALQLERRISVLIEALTDDAYFTDQFVELTELIKQIFSVVRIEESISIDTGITHEYQQIDIVDHSLVNRSRKVAQG